jgi:hypothetical protein
VTNALSVAFDPPTQQCESSLEIAGVVDLVESEKGYQAGVSGPKKA